MQNPQIIEPLDLTDRSCFERVFREHQLPLAHYALRLTRNTAIASDIVQDVFLAVWERRHVIDAGPAFRSLLFTMVRNRALNVLRKDARLVWKDESDEGPNTAADVPLADDDLEASSLRVHFLRWIGGLPPRRAEAFMLSRDQGLAYAEIAEIMNVSVRTVETHVLQALRTLRANYDAMSTQASSEETAP